MSCGNCAGPCYTLCRPAGRLLPAVTPRPFENRTQQEQLKENKDQRDSLHARNQDLKEALAEAEAMLARQKKDEEAIELVMEQLSIATHIEG